jgi:hypothetical protein
VTFIGAQPRLFTGEAGGSGAVFGQEGRVSFMGRGGKEGAGSAQEKFEQSIIS